MNAFHDQPHHCTRHPHRPTVGVCASCVRDRLGALEKFRIRNGPHSSFGESSSAAPGRRRSSRPVVVDSSTASLALSDKEEGPSSILQTLKSDASAPASPERNHRSISTPSPRSHHGNKSLPSRRSDASESDRLSKTSQSTSLRSLFQNGEDGQESRSKAKTLQSSSPLRMADGGGQCRIGARTKESHEAGRQDQLSSVLRSPGYSSGTKPKEATGSSSRQTYTADLEVITESSRGSESSIKLDIHHNDSTSWISSLFQRKKPRSKSVSVSKNSTVETGSNGLIESSRSSLDAGRLSSDGVRPNFRQILKKQEAERKQGLADRSSRETDFANRCSKTDREREDLASMPASRLAILNLTERSSVSVEIPNDRHRGSAPPAPFVSGKISRSDSRAEGRCKDPASSSSQAHQPTSQVIEATAGRSSGVLEDDGHLSRSRSWGRAWSKTLSPLLGFKQRNRKGATKDEGLISSQHPSCTPNHNQTGAHQTTSHISKDSSAAFSFYFSPLRRSRRAGRGSIRVPQ